MLGLMLKFLAAAGIAVVIAWGAGAWWGYSKCSTAAQVRQLQAERDMLRRTLEKREQIARADAEQAERDRAELATLDATNRNLTDELENAARICLDSPHTERLRGIWPEP
jgi:hypothetical protein